MPPPSAHSSRNQLIRPSGALLTGNIWPEINHNHWLANGLLTFTLATPIGMFEIIHRVYLPFSGSNISPVLTPAGPAWQFGASGTTDAYALYRETGNVSKWMTPPSTSQIAAACGFVVPASYGGTSSTKRLFSWADSTASNGMVLDVSSGNPSAWIVIGGTVHNANAGFPGHWANTAGTHWAFGGSYDGATVAIHIPGTTPFGISVTGAPTGPFTTLIFGDSGADTPGTPITWGATWQRSILQLEMQSALLGRSAPPPGLLVFRNRKLYSFAPGPAPIGPAQIGNVPSSKAFLAKQIIEPKRISPVVSQKRRLVGVIPASPPVLAPAGNIPASKLFLNRQSIINPITAGPRKQKFRQFSLAPSPAPPIPFGLVPPIFPTLPEGFPVRLSLVLDTIIGTTKSLREMRVAQQPTPLWDIEIPFEELLDETQNQTPFSSFLGYQQYEELVQLWLMMYGQGDIFAFDAPWDNSRLNQQIGVGDGTTYIFPIYRSWAAGGILSLLPIGMINTISSVEVNGVAVPNNHYATSRNKIYFQDSVGATYPPGNGLPITMTFTFYYLCRFVEDEQDFEEFGKNRWTVPSLKFRAVVYP